MLALFEVLSFKGWLDVRDVLIKAVGPVRTKFKLQDYLLVKLSLCETGPCHLHSHLHFLGLHDRIDPLRRCGNCKLFREQGHSVVDRGSEKMVSNSV